MGWDGVGSALICALALLAASPAARADDAAGPDDWTWEAGLSAGWATSRGQRIVALLPRIEAHYARDGAYGNGYAALAGDAFLQYQPKGGFAGGASLLLGYALPELGPVRPFVEGGAGLLGVEMDRPRQRDGFNFSLHVGGGLRIALGERLSLVPAYRYIHVSNAGTRLPNGGFDFQTVLLGFSYRLD